MPQTTEETEVFIVRVWREHSDDDDIPPRIRLVVEHVATDQRRYFDDLKKVPEFMAHILIEIGWK